MTLSLLEDARRIRPGPEGSGVVEVEVKEAVIGELFQSERQWGREQRCRLDDVSTSNTRL